MILNFLKDAPKNEWKKVKKLKFQKRQNYDYIVLGAGSAGSVMAKRLSEDNSSIAVMEAGRSFEGSILDWWKIAMPSALTFNLANDKYNWDFHTTPQKHLNNRQLHQPRGKVTGGSSCLNAMVYVRGHPEDFERWKNESNLPSWGYENVLPYFKKSQKHLYTSDHPETSKDAQYRGNLGLLHTRTGDKTYRNELFDAFVEAGRNAGYPISDNLNGYMGEGFGDFDMTVTPKGERCHTGLAFLKNAEYSGLVDTFTKSRVTRILFNDKGTGDSQDVNREERRAIGIEYLDNWGFKQKLYADKEVIVCMGAVGSPQLLNLSGIGGGEDLKRLEIEDVIYENDQVGQNLQDHLEYYVQDLCKLPVSLYPLSTWRHPIQRTMAGVKWFLSGKGVCASNQFDTGGFIRTRPGIKHPDFQYHFIPGCVVGQLDFLPHHGYQAHGGTLRPTSRGSVKTISKDIRIAPEIDPNYLATEEDVIDMRNGFKLTREILDSEPLKSKYKLSQFNPKPEQVDTDEKIDEWIRNYSHSAYHLSCTNAMGKVVDEEGKVYGVKNLRVVDASIMPTMTSGNLNAPTIMLAEKIADSVRGRTPLPKAEGVDWYINPEWETKQR